MLLRPQINVVDLYSTYHGMAVSLLSNISILKPYQEPGYYSSSWLCQINKVQLQLNPPTPDIYTTNHIWGLAYTNLAI